MFGKLKGNKEILISFFFFLYLFIFILGVLYAILIRIFYCLFFISLFSLLERSDYINLIVSIIVIYCFIFDKDSNIIKSLRQYLLLLGGAVVFDFIWFITNFGSFFIGEQGDPESGIKRLIYFFGICSTVIKCLLVLALLHLRRKKLPIESKIEEE